MTHHDIAALSSHLSEAIGSCNTQEERTGALRAARYVTNALEASGHLMGNGRMLFVKAMGVTENKDGILV